MSERSPSARPSATAARAARRGRIHALRVRVAMLSVAVFLGAWGIVFGQLVTGRDPALARDVAPVAAQSADPSVTSDDRQAAASATGDTATAAVTAPEPVVTRQS